MALTPTMTPELKAAVAEMTRIMQLKNKPARYGRKGGKPFKYEAQPTRKLAEVALYEKIGADLYHQAQFALTMPVWFAKQVMSDEVAMVNHEALCGIKPAMDTVDYYRMDVIYDGKPVGSHVTGVAGFETETEDMICEGELEI